MPRKSIETGGTSKVITNFETYQLVVIYQKHIYFHGLLWRVRAELPLLDVDEGLDLRFCGVERDVPDSDRGRFSFRLRLRRALTTEGRTPENIVLMINFQSLYARFGFDGQVKWLLGKSMFTNHRFDTFKILEAFKTSLTSIVEGDENSKVIQAN